MSAVVEPPNQQYKDTGNEEEQHDKRKPARSALTLHAPTEQGNAKHGAGHMTPTSVRKEVGHPGENHR